MTRTRAGSRRKKHALTKNALNGQIRRQAGGRRPEAARVRRVRRLPQHLRQRAAPGRPLRGQGARGLRADPGPGGALSGGVRRREGGSGSGGEIDSSLGVGSDAGAVVNAIGDDGRTALVAVAVEVAVAVAVVVAVGIGSGIGVAGIRGEQDVGFGVVLLLHGGGVYKAFSLAVV
ncbi:hypothetical protein ON010_g8735 [Phytophthora cinnamomi]|nr:hypothetical protein ON010_g8735 [Phytophthora cinnamomi]